MKRIDLWKLSFEDGMQYARELNGVLSQSEQDRIGRFRQEEDRMRCLLGRGGLRWILSRSYLDQEPDVLEFHEPHLHKPRLRDPGLAEEYRFNVTHSGKLCLIAVAQRLEVGVDVEEIQNREELLSVAKNYFSNTELEALQALDPHLRIPAFFRLWTRKEAFLKARGEGLSTPLHGFSVSADPGCAAALLAAPFDPAATARWEICDLPIDPGYAAAVAAETKDVHICWRNICEAFTE